MTMDQIFFLLLSVSFLNPMQILLELQVQDEEDNSFLDYLHHHSYQPFHEVSKFS